MEIPYEDYTREILRAYHEGVEAGQKVERGLEFEQIARTYWQCHGKDSHVIHYVKFMKKMFPTCSIRDCTNFVPSTHKFKQTYLADE